MVQLRVSLQQAVEVLTAGSQDEFMHLEGLCFGGDGEVAEEPLLAHLVHPLQKAGSMLRGFDLRGCAVEAVGAAVVQTIPVIEVLDT